MYYGRRQVKSSQVAFNAVCQTHTVTTQCSLNSYKSCKNTLSNNKNTAATIGARKFVSFPLKGAQDAFTYEGLFFTLIILLLNMSSSGLILVMFFSSDLDDKHDISRGRSALVSQINNVLCFFRTLE